jgi:hypothetical protein
MAHVGTHTDPHAMHLMLVERRTMEDRLDIKPEVVDRLRRTLKGFAPATPENVTTKSDSRVRFKVPPERLPLATLPYLALLAIGCTNLGRGEKLAWAIPFSFGGAYCELSHEKFGIRLYIDKSLVSDESAGAKVAETIISTLDKAQRLLESQVLRPLAMDELQHGRVLIQNQYHSLRETYEYFRDGAALAYDGKGRVNRLNRLFAEQAEGFHNTIAMVGGYFSLLEHILVLVSPFIHSVSIGQDLLRFIGDKWSSKFKTVFDVKADKSAKRLHDELARISEDYRNTFAHGGFNKSKASIGFRIPGAGWMPAMLSDVRESPHFNFVPTTMADYQAICRLFDDLDEWLDTGAAKYGMVWAKEGLNVRFDADFEAEFHQALDEDRFAELVERTSLLMDLHANMDY